MEPKLRTAVRVAPSLLFLLGPSGVGQSDLIESIQAELGFELLDIDQRNGFHANGLSREWYTFSTRLDLAPLVAKLHQRIAASGAKGLVVSFPSTRVLSAAQVEAASQSGIQTIVLWGNEAQCLAARRFREEKAGFLFDETRYRRSNHKAFATYGAPEFADYRLLAFRQDGSRSSRDDIFARLKQRIAGQSEWSPGIPKRLAGPTGGARLPPPPST